MTEIDRLRNALVLMLREYEGLDMTELCRRYGMSKSVIIRKARAALVADTLRRAKALIPDEDHWFIGCLGRTLPSPGRLGHCPITAFDTICGGMLGDAYDAAKSAFKRANGIKTSIPEWNNADERVFADIPAAFDRAIALAEAEG